MNEIFEYTPEQIQQDKEGFTNTLEQHLKELDERQKRLRNKTKKKKNEKKPLPEFLYHVTTEPMHGKS